MPFPAALRDMQRPAVEFDHAKHTAALEQEGCETCHPIEERLLTQKLTPIIELGDRDSVIDAFHGSCIGCHEKRADSSQKSGPITCGECHLRRTPGVSARSAMAFDYSLHGRHSKAFEDKCENCHHVYDEAEKKLKYEKGKEEGCAACHGAQDEERRLSLANASHRSCISCHLARIDDQLEAGPVHCAGCHEVESQLAIRKLDGGSLTPLGSPPPRPSLRRWPSITRPTRT